MSGVKTYTGIADCHGLESFNEHTDTRAQYIMSVRANANPQRHAVVYEADMKRDDASLVVQLCEENPETALKFMNSQAVEVRVVGGERAAKLWKNIPNPKLDPYH